VYTLEIEARTRGYGLKKRVWAPKLGECGFFWELDEAQIGVGEEINFGLRYVQR